jgi:hypothetical protein
LAGNKPFPDDLKTQYDKLSEDWRQLNSMLWQIPSAAVSIFSAIVIVAYQQSLEGWPRFIMLAVSFLFLFALTLEVVKKALYMNVISNRLKNLQKELLKLKTDTEFVNTKGIAFDPSPEEVRKLSDIIDTEPSPEEVRKLSDIKPKEKNILLRRLHGLALKGREVLAWVIFLASISVAILAGMELSYILHVISR